MRSLGKGFMRNVAAMIKLVKVVAHLLHGLLVVYVIFPKLTQPQKNQRVEAWASALLAKLAIKLIVNGAPPAAGPVLRVSNHISWLDIPVMHGARHCRFVSKADVKHWPVFGALASAGGTLYIERESSRDAMRVVHHICEALSAGDSVAVFPEGTTGNGVDLLPFHANLLQAAIVCQAPVQPLALSYVDAATGHISQAASFVGDQTLFGSLWSTLKSNNLAAVLTYGEPQLANDRNRRMWAADLRVDIARLKAISTPVL
jgi:1-acyl-sn-glycerol-3-phosphate acyltransferase